MNPYRSRCSIPQSNHCRTPPCRFPLKGNPLIEPYSILKRSPILESYSILKTNPTMESYRFPLKEPYYGILQMPLNPKP